MNAEQILEEFAEAAQPPTGRRFFDGEAGAVAFRPSKDGKDWGAYIIARTERRGPDECWPWKGGARVTVSDGRGKLVNGKRKQERPSVSLDYSRLIFRETRGYLPKGLVFSTCGETWCANPRHFSDNVKDRPKRRIIIMGKQGAIATRTLSSVPKAAPAIAAPVVVASMGAGAAIGACVEALRGLDDGERARVLAAVSAFYMVQR